MKGGLDEALRLFEAENAQSQSAVDTLRYIIMFTDGVTTDDLSSSISKANEIGINVFTIAFGEGLLQGDNFEINGQQILRDISRKAGGKFYYCDDISTVDPEVENPLTDAAGEILQGNDEYDYDTKTDSNQDGISDYDTKLLISKKIPDGYGKDVKAFGTHTFEEVGAEGTPKDFDGDTLNNGKEVHVYGEFFEGDERKTFKKIYADYKSSPILKDTDGDGLDDYKDSEPLVKNPAFTVTDDTTPYIGYLGSVHDYGSLVNDKPTIREVYVFEENSLYAYALDDIKAKFDDGGEYSEDILVIDATTDNKVNYIVYNSYKYSEYTLKKETVTLIILYNNLTKKRKDRWERTVDGMIREWDFHSAVFYGLIEDSNNELLKQSKHSAKDTDFDDEAEPFPLLFK